MSAIVNLERSMTILNHNSPNLVFHLFADILSPRRKIDSLIVFTEETKKLCVQHCVFFHIQEQLSEMSFTTDSNYGYNLKWKLRINHQNFEFVNICTVYLRKTIHFLGISK